MLKTAEKFCERSKRATDGEKRWAQNGLFPRWPVPKFLLWQVACLQGTKKPYRWSYITSFLTSINFMYDTPLDSGTHCNLDANLDTNLGANLDTNLDTNLGATNGLVKFSLS